MNVSLIPQVDGVVDSRDSLDGTPDSIDLTESPEKNTKTQKHIERQMKTQVTMTQMKRLLMRQMN